MKPQVTPLAFWHRKLIFRLLLLAFLFSLPVFMFYATGYRYDLFSPSPSITATGALYIVAESPNSTIYIDGIEVIDARVFRDASFIQGLVPKLHRVHVQAPSLHTWVKDLTVYPHIVTEAESFNMPLIPQVRPVTAFMTVNGEAVFLGSTTTPALFSFASSTIEVVATTSTATSTYRANAEFTLLTELFAEKASTTKARNALKESKEAFRFSTSTPTKAEVAIATTTIVSNNISLSESDGRLYASAFGEGRQVPHYFCISQVEIDAALNLPDTPIAEEGELFFEDTLTELHNNTRECRDSIKMDTQGQSLIDFTFFPNTEDLVLMQLENGLYVIEVDDRGWQNAQLLYPGSGFSFLVNSGSIFIEDGTLIFEVITELPVL